MSARRLRLVTPEDAHEAATEKFIREAIEVARKFAEHRRLGHKSMSVGAGDGLVEAAKELFG